MLTMSRLISGKTSELTVKIDITPLTAMNTINRLAATGFFANHAIMPFTTLPPARCYSTLPRLHPEGG